MTLLNKIFTYINLLILAAVPSVVVILQGEYKMSFWPDSLNWLIISIQILVSAILIIVLVMKISQMRKPLQLFLSGPLASLIIALLLYNDWKVTFYNLYFVEGAMFLVGVTFMYVSHVKYGKKEAGKWNAYLFAPLFLLILLGGFLSTLNFNYFFDTYNNWLDYVALSVIVAVGVFGMNYDQEMERNEQGVSTSLNTVILVIGITVFLFVKIAYLPA